jgi:hypothetical protein
MSINFNKNPKYEFHKNSINIGRYVTCGKTEADRYDNANSSYSHLFGNMRKKVSLGNTMG